jgi:cation transport regulator ChaB
VEGWGKIVAGVVLGVAGTVYATNEEIRKQLPRTARDLPENVRRRFESAVSAAREASSKRREEILRDLAEHDAAHASLAARLAPEEEPAEPAPVEQNTREESR